MSSLKKKVLVLSEKLLEKIRHILGEDKYEYSTESQEGNSAEYTFIDESDQLTQIEGKGILVGPCANFKEAFSGPLIASLHSSQIEHEVGQVALKRLLGENSSLGLETVFQKSNIQFKNFRLMDHMMMGHYSDVLAREAYLKGHRPLPIRNFFDSLASFLYQFEQERRVSFPYDVDFGIWDDLFVMQVHCSANDLKLDDLTQSLGDYRIDRPQDGLLKLALSQTDCLDIYQLDSSKRLVICAQWFHPLRKKQYSSFFPSLMIHQVDKYSPFQGVSSKNILNPLSASKLKSYDPDSESRLKSNGQIFDNIVHKLNQLDVEELTRIVAGKEGDSEGIQKVKSWLGVDDSFARVAGKIEEDDSFSRVTGKIEEDDSHQLISGSNVEDIERAWKIKKDQIIDNLQEKFIVKTDQSEAPEKEVEHILASVFQLDDSNESGLKKMVQELVPTEELKPRWDFDAKRSEQDLIKKDAQILRMKKLIDRMKAEISARNTIDGLPTNTDELTQGLTLAMAESESKRLTQELKKQQTINEKIKAFTEKQLKAKDAAIAKLEQKLTESKEAILEGQSSHSSPQELTNLENQNESLRNQLDVSKKRISQMSETILNNNRNAKEKESKELVQLKETLAKAQEAMTKFKYELEEAKRELNDKEAENKALMKHFNDVKDEEQIAGPSKEKVELEEAQAQIEELKGEMKNINDLHKAQHLELKKLEQKNRFLTAQLETAQKKGPVVANKTQNTSMNDAQAGKKVKQLEKVVEAMKDNEQKVQQELIAKKDELQKMKAESMALKNKVGELERKLQKYEKEAA